MSQLSLRVAPSGDLVEWDGEGPMPLALFPLDDQERIAAAVAQPRPPEKWLSLGCAQIHSRAWLEWYRQRGVDPYRLREHIPAWMRDAVIERDGDICQLCGDPVAPSDVLHLDHIVPHSLGGHDTVANLQVAHALCNMRKGNRV